MRENFAIGLGLGVVLSLLVNLFIVWGGLPRGMYWRIEDNRENISKLKDNFSEHTHIGIYGKIAEVGNDKSD